MNMGGANRQVPLSTFAEVDYTSAYGGIKRKNQKRVITLSSNVLSGFNPNKVMASVQTAMKEFKTPEGVTAELTGEKEEQKEAASFLGRSLMISIFIILMILVLQFNSFSPDSNHFTNVPPIALSCDTFSEKTGKTGRNASPKVAFAWNFNDIHEINNERANSVVRNLNQNTYGKNPFFNKQHRLAQRVILDENSLLKMG